MTLFAVTRLELRRLFVRPLGWIIAALALAELGWRFALLLQIFLLNQVRLAALPDGPGYTDLVAVRMYSSFITGSPLPFGVIELALLLVPLLTMSTLAGERSAGTLPLLFASGLSATRILLGKYLAVLIWLALWLLLALAIPVSLAHGARLDWGMFAAATLGSFLALAVLAAIGVAASAYAAHPAVAAVAALMLGLALSCINLGAQLAGVSNGFVNWLAMSTHQETLLRGLVSSADIVWFLLAIAVALALGIQRLASDRERG
ncbi:ABC transporter permease subunit [Dyella acidiphila]|uniref:ABC transporter permease subunit n=1 Tax=Dyella acidiphila TaxID=2775866 RepID=A0ABR9G833_9GAMM|nr:ABC transporter permease subunit [Dyella acidiphila]MBE1160193.1 ABC transporter permease subunit [Dyella acidiphila]